MNKIEIAPGIMSYKNVINHATPLHLQIESAMKTANLDWDPAYVRSGNKDTVDTNYRDTGTLYLRNYDQKVDNYSTPADSLFSSLSNLFLEKFKPIQENYKNHYSTTSSSNEDYAILKYGVGQKFVDHVDNFNNTRSISMVYYMNDDYEGGEIVFPRFNIIHKPEKDEMLMFPSIYVYNHEVLPVKSGVRYAVASWLK
jgi:Rps23 Pro-64 3,4-dihydroxylase Tpa1-like proline 4-hydroxylase